jgi:hypothetical protein
MKSTITTVICLLIGLSFSYAQSEDKISRAEAEQRLASKMAERVQEITAKVDARLSQLQPVVRTMPPAQGEDRARTLVLWLQDGKAQKLEVSEPGKETTSIFYFADEELFFVTQPHSRFIFIGGQLEYWMDESWTPNRVQKSLLTERENFLYDEANNYLTWLYERL